MNNKEIKQKKMKNENEVPEKKIFIFFEDFRN